jgi:hypothetical protein
VKRGLVQGWNPGPRVLVWLLCLVIVSVEFNYFGLGTSCASVPLLLPCDCLSDVWLFWFLGCLTEICCRQADWKDNNNFGAKVIIVVIFLLKGYMRDYASYYLCAWICWFSPGLCLADPIILVVLVLPWLILGLCWVVLLNLCYILSCWLSWMPIWDDRNNLRTKLYNLISGGPKVTKCDNYLFWGLYA